MLKLDGLHKHSGKRKSKYAKPRQIIGEYYINFDTQHAKNSCVYYIIRPNFILNQVVNVEKVQKKEKSFQFVIIFHLLQQGRPLIDYECMQGFFRFLKLSKLPKCIGLF